MVVSGEWDWLGGTGVGVEGIWEDTVVVPPAQSEHGVRVPPDWTDLFRILHPVGNAAPPMKRTQTGEGAKPLPTETFWERWVTGPIGRAGSAIGNFLTAPLRALKTTGLWLGGGLVVVLLVAVVGLVVVLRIINAVQER